MNYSKYTKTLFYALMIVFITISLVDAKKKKGKGKGKKVAAAAVVSNSSAHTDSATKTADHSDKDVAAAISSAASGPTEGQLSEVYQKMAGATNGIAMNLDSSFGGGRCNCVCEDNN